MKKVLLGVLVAGLLSVVASADSKAGQKVFLKSFKSSFGMSGVKFAAEHSVAEWTDLFADGAKGFIGEYSEKYPKAAPVLNNPDMAGKIQDLGDFAKEFGNDSGNVPSCG